MLLLLTPRQLARLNPSPESRTLLQTGEIRLARPSDRVTELSENALFLVRLSHIRTTAAIVATWDRGRLILHTLKNRNPARALILLRFARRLFVRRSRRVISASPIRRTSTIYGAMRTPARGLRRMNWHIAFVKKRIPSGVPRERIRSDYCERPS